MQNNKGESFRKKIKNKILAEFLFYANIFIKLESSRKLLSVKIEFFRTRNIVFSMHELSTY